MTSQEAQQYCTALTKRSGSNFYYSFFFLPREQRAAMYAVYAFCREVDSIVDDPMTASDPQECLASRRTELMTVYRHGERDKRLGRDALTSPLTICLAEHVQRFSIPHAYLENIIAGVEMDLTVNRYQTFEELAVYCHRVASAVGLVCLKIFGTTRPESEVYAINLGLAFQLTNILRDLKADAARGRIYLPLEDLKRFGVTEQEILENVYSPAFRRLMEFECARAEDYYHRAQAALTDSDRGVLLPAEIMRAIYSVILQRIKDAEYQVFKKRMTLSSCHRLAIALRVWLAGLTIRNRP
jgi:15-cis-phytoene synthase